jgi:hypothetical protein
MRLGETTLVGVDAQAVGPPDLFDQHPPARWKSRAPHVRRLPDASGFRVFEVQIPIIGRNAVVGRRPEEYADWPAARDRMRSVHVVSRLGLLRATKIEEERR